MGWKPHQEAPSLPTRCAAHLFGMAIDTLRRAAAGTSYRAEFPKWPTGSFKTILPPLRPATLSQSFTGVKDTLAQGSHFPHIF